MVYEPTIRAVADQREENKLGQATDIKQVTQRKKSQMQKLRQTK